MSGRITKLQEPKRITKFDFPIPKTICILKVALKSFKNKQEKLITLFLEQGVPKRVGGEGGRGGAVLTFGKKIPNLFIIPFFLADIP